jgi:hypothetical protein
MLTLAVLLVVVLPHNARLRTPLAEIINIGRIDSTQRDGAV